MVKEQKINKLSKESELNFYLERALNDKHTRVEFIRKRNRQKAGVMISCVDPIDPKKVIVGFSLCHLGYDDFDKINCGWQEVKDFGKKVAHRRAMKYRDFAFAVVYSDRLEEKEIGTVYIPQTVHESLAKFVHGCYVYYKDKSFPDWVENYFPKHLALEGKNDEEENTEESTVDA